MEFILGRAAYFKVKRMLETIMKTFLFLFCSSVFSLTPGTIFSQNTYITIDSDKVISIDEVFNIVKKQTDYNFIHKSNIFQGYPKVSVKKGKIKTETLLRSSLSSGNFTINISNDNTITITENTSASDSQQEVLVKGQVKDIYGMPLPGMTVYISSKKPSGTQLEQANLVEATATDMDGNFFLGAKRGYYIVATGIGYQMYSEEISPNKEVYNIELKEDVSNLDEVVVVGYGTTKRKKLTGSVSTVKSEDISQINAQTIDQALVGKMSGVFVSAQSGAPGSGSIVHVRGLSQLIGDNQPLYVVDGVPIVINPRVAGESGLSDNRQNPLLSINPADIERVDVLKDASSAAIYGSRAANGVVLITTKRGKRNQVPRFNFSYNTIFQNPTRTYDVLSAQQFKTYLTDQGLEDEIDFGTADTNWQDKITNTNALWHQYGLSVSGGGEKINYLVSGNVNDQEGIMLGNKLTRYSFSSSLDADLTDHLRVGSNISYNYAINKQSGLNSLSQGAFYRPDLPVYNEDGSFSFQDFSGVHYLNPLGDEAKVRNKSVGQYLYGSIYGEYQLFSGLRFKSQLSVNLNNDKSNNFNPSYTRRGLENGALLFIQHTSGVSTSWSNTLNFSKTIAEDHNIDALAGISWDHSRLNLDSQTYLGFPDDEILTDVNSAQSVLNYSSQSTQTALNSLFGRVNYSYKDRYLATFTGRYDGSIKFGPNNRRGFFPSAALAWNVHNESFLNDNELISQLKLRASLGRTGSDNLPAFSYLVNYLSLGSTDSYYDGVNGIAVDGVPNLDIKWEETDQLDLGVELGLFNNRMNAQVVYFEKNTSGIILLVPVASQTGFSSWNANIADVSNKGWEIELGGDIIRAKDFRWNSSFNISFIENNVDALNNGATTNFGSTGIIEGEPIGVITGYDVVSIAQTQEEIDALNAAAPSGTYYSGLTQPGDYIYRDINGDNEITVQDIHPLGDINPNYYGGWNNSLSYKNFDFSFNFNFVQGNKRNWYRGATELSSVSTTSNVTTRIYDTWTPENTGAEYARIGSATHGNSTTTSKNVKAGDYIRLRSASLAYNIPKEWLENTGINNLRLTLSGNNLFTISNYPGIDPESVETQRGGATVDLRRDTGASYPQARTVSIGFNLSL